MSKKKTYPMGVIHAAPDPRDYSVAVGAVKYPDKIELDMPPIRDQGSTNQCVMFSSMAGPELYYGERMGTSFGYGRWRGRKSNGDVKDHEGMYIEDFNSGFTKEGTVLFADDPELLDTPSAIKYAAKNADRLLPTMVERAGWTYAALHSVDEIKAVLVRAQTEPGIVITATVAVHGFYPDANHIWLKDGKFAGHHQVAIKGYQTRKTVSWPDDTKEYCHVRNSWGTGWGDNGDCYMEWEDILECGAVTAYFPPAKAEPTPSPAPTPAERRTLKKGMTGNDVKYMQELLLNLDYYLGSCGADGDFGSATERAVEAFQQFHGLEVDGVCGPKTWMALETGTPQPEPKPTPSPEPVVIVRRTLRKGMKGDDVKYLQQQLFRLGLDLGKWGADGDFGSATESAVKAFQRMHALTVDGICGPKTWAVLDSGAEWEEPETGMKRRFLKYLREQIGQMYVWGGNGEEMTPAKIKKMENSTSNYQRALRYYESLVAKGKNPILGYDCSGLISRFLQNEGIVTKKRNSRHLADMSDMFFDRTRLEPFDLVFRYSGSTYKKADIYHVGVYVGNGMVIESQGRDAGVVERDINASGSGYWNAYGRLRDMED